MEETIDILKEIPLFSELNEDELRQLTGITKTQTYTKRQYIFMEGEQREAVFFIRRGVIKTFKLDEEGHEQVISLLPKGEMFPHVGFFDDTPYPATAETLQTSELLVIGIDDFDELLMNQPQIAVKIMKIMGQKIVMLTQRVQELTSQDVRHRVIRALIRLAEESGREAEEGIYIDLPITHNDFANLVGATRESISRVFSQLKKQNLLASDRHRLVIYDIKALENFNIKE